MPDDPLVTTAWLAERLDAPDIRIVDASWWMPAEGRDAKSEYAAVHIPGAVFFDIDEIADEASDLPHMLPSPAKFASRVRKMGLGDGSRIVVYDASGVRSAARVWWTFRVMGHEDVVVLDGGLPKWIAEGRATTDRTSTPGERHFTARLMSDLVRDARQVGQALNSRREQIVDARPAARFTGAAPEPRVGLQSGHMPGALNVPMPEVIAPDGTMKSAAALAKIFADAGVDVTKSVATTCGSGITASVLALALARLGRWRTAVYDGSWAEWGALPDAPIVSG